MHYLLDILGLVESKSPDGSDGLGFSGALSLAISQQVSNPSDCESVEYFEMIVSIHQREFHLKCRIRLYTCENAD